ncbi:hypothetical protein LCGC14_2892480, partial [marine sediment metagenome]
SYQYIWKNCIVLVFFNIDTGNPDINNIDMET